MDIQQISFLGGLLMGLASTLHCAGMCGGIASSLVFLHAPNGDASARARVLMTAQAGRVTAYVIAGALVGALGAGVFGALDRTLAYRIMQWGAAVTLVWIGLTVAGWLPPLTVLDRLLAPVTRRLVDAPKAVGAVAPFITGLIWGLLPCAMVYGALFTAMLTGTATGGAGVMLGFGLGTLPAVTAAAFGLTSLKALAHRPSVRVAVGLLIAAAGVAGLVLSMPGGPLCIV